MNDLYICIMPCYAESPPTLRSICFLRSTRYSVPFAVTRATLSRAIQYYIVHHVRKPSTASIQTVLDILRHLDSVGQSHQSHLLLPHECIFCAVASRAARIRRKTLRKRTRGTNPRSTRATDMNCERNDRLDVYRRSDVWRENLIRSFVHILAHWYTLRQARSFVRVCPHSMLPRDGRELNVTLAFPLIVYRQGNDAIGANLIRSFRICTSVRIETSLFVRLFAHYASMRRT